jgi:hypothetical protein
LLHVHTLVYWLKTLELGVIVHSSNLTRELLVLELLLARLAHLIETLVWVSWILAAVLRFLLLLELHHLLLSLWLFLRERSLTLNWLKTLSRWLTRNVRLVVALDSGWLLELHEALSRFLSLWIGHQLL